MKKTECVTVKLAKGEMSVYDFGGVRLHAYKTDDPIADEVFTVEKNGKAVVIEPPCFYDNIAALTEYLNSRKIEAVAKLVAYHAAGASFYPQAPAYGTRSSDAYNTAGGGAQLINSFVGAFGDAFDGGITKADSILDGGETQIAGIGFVILPNAEAYDIEIPEINCVYTHMLGHDCHSIVAGAAHADGMIAQLEHYKERGFDLVLTSHYTPEDLKDAQTKIDYLRELKAIASESKSADEMRARAAEKFAQYGGLNYLDMTVGMFFPEK